MRIATRLYGARHPKTELLEGIRCAQDLPSKRLTAQRAIFTLSLSRKPIQIGEPFMKMFIAGEWVDRDERIDVLNPFDGSIIDTVPNGTPADVDAAIASAERGAKVMAAMSAYDRYKILHRAGEIMTERAADLGKTITLEEGKVIAEGMGETARAQETIELSAEEAKRLTGGRSI